MTILVFEHINKFRHFYKNDISETDAYNPQEALEKAQEWASRVYGVKYTKFLTNGSSIGIISSVLSCVKSGEKVNAGVKKSIKKYLILH